MLLTAFFAQTQTSFGIRQTVYFSLISRNVISNRYYMHDSSFSHSFVCKARNLVKEFKFSV